MTTVIASSLGFSYGVPVSRGDPLVMADYISDIAYPLLDVEEMLLEQRGAREVPFPGMDKSGRGVCIRNEQGNCAMGAVCPFRHIVGDKLSVYLPAIPTLLNSKAVVCKHWLRGLCKKGDQCEFLHEYDLSKMPECFFFSKYMACSNRECPFRHIDPESKIKDCPWFDRGFCRHGPLCKHRHRRRVLCPNYLAGFCPEGKSCKYAHPSFSLPPAEVSQGQRIKGNIGIVCHNCHERGHKATYCPHLPTQSQLPVMEVSQQSTHETTVQIPVPDKKALSEVTCYKCGEKGHYANRCHKGVLAFLSNTAHLAHEQRERDEKEGRFANQTYFGGAANRAQPQTQLQNFAANSKPGEMLR